MTTILDLQSILSKVSHKFEILIISDSIKPQLATNIKLNKNHKIPDTKLKLIDYFNQFDFSPVFSSNCLSLHKKFSLSTDIPVFDYKDLLESLNYIRKSYPITEYEYPTSVSRFKIEWLLLKLRDEFKQLEPTSKRVPLKNLSPDSQKAVLTIDSHARIGDPFFLLEESIAILDKIPKSKAYFENNRIIIEFFDKNKAWRNTIDLSQKGDVYPKPPPSHSTFENTLTLSKLFTHHNITPITKTHIFDNKLSIFGKEYTDTDTILQSSVNFFGYSLRKINGKYHINKKQPANFDKTDIASFMLATLPRSISQMFNSDRESLIKGRRFNDKSELRRMPFYIQKIEKDFRELQNSMKIQKLEISQLNEIDLSLYCLYFCLPALAQILFLRKEQLSSLIQKHFEFCVLEFVDVKLGDGSTESTLSIYLDGGPLLLRQSINLELTRRLLKSR